MVKQDPIIAPPSLCVPLFYFVVGALAHALLQWLLSDGASSPLAALARHPPPAPLLPPPALGEAIEPHSGIPWPAEFRTWVNPAAPLALSEIFSARASKHGTDKTTSHRYQYMYAKYLLPLRHLNISLLEIGLGCGMPWGAGHSLSLWRELLPRATYYSIEFDAKCAEEFRSELGNRLFVGDQGDPAFVNRVLDAVGPLHVIIDDGSHRVEHQRASLLHLLPGLLPGGLYLLEDLQCAFMPDFGGEASGMADSSSVRMVHEIVLSMLGRGPSGDVVAHGLYGRVESVDCFYDACVFTKAPIHGTWPGPPRPAWVRPAQAWERKSPLWQP